MGDKGGKSTAVRTIGAWLRRQPVKLQAALATLAAVAAFIFLLYAVRDYNKIFMASEFVHAVGISILVHKLFKDRTCAGLSLKSQEFTAIFLAIRVLCSFIMEYDAHTILDTATLLATLWVIYTMRYTLRSSYMEDKDRLEMYIVIAPCAVIALLIHPPEDAHLVIRLLWAFCAYLEAVSVYPQLRLMQKIRIIEPSISHYVFSLGVARFLNCAHWILRAIRTRGYIVFAFWLETWTCGVFIAEIVQTYILADFCYYYVKSFIEGDLILRLPSNRA